MYRSGWWFKVIKSDVKTNVTGPWGLIARNKSLLSNNFTQLLFATADNVIIDMIDVPSPRWNITGLSQDTALTSACIRSDAVQMYTMYPTRI